MRNGPTAWYFSQLKTGLKMARHTVDKVKKSWRSFTGADRFDNLPLLCGARDPANNQPVAIWRGQMGYFLWSESEAPEEWNKAHQISPAQVRAMIEGSVLGWQINQAKSQAPKK
jgi:hypothetical protein